MRSRDMFHRSYLINNIANGYSWKRIDTKGRTHVLLGIHGHEITALTAPSLIG